MTPPILFIIFNRPDTTKRVFEEIRKAKPARFFVAADGPRTGNVSDIAKCEAAREICLKVDWPCEVKTLFRTENLGCGRGPAEAITWFFEHVEQGVILEDDCLPGKDFFRFCDELLQYYKNTPRIMHISGNNFQRGKKRGNGSYYFSEYSHNWGWATWRRAWKSYDFNCLPAERRRTVWDKQWQISIRKHKGLGILPNVNLVSNIGFGEDATHTKQAEYYSNLPTQEMAFPLKHPRMIRRNISADFFTHRIFFKGSTKGFIIKEVMRLSPETTGKIKKILRDLNPFSS